MSVRRTEFAKPTFGDNFGHGGCGACLVGKMGLEFELNAEGDELEKLENSWRSSLAHDSRTKIVKRIMDTLKRHMPVAGQDGEDELLKIAWQFEEKIFQVATDQQDYLRKISLKMLSLETEANPLQNRYPPGAQEVATPGSSGGAVAMRNPAQTTENGVLLSEAQQQLQ